MSMFEQASRLKLRFNSPKGQLAAEDLWDLPLTSSNPDKANLDVIAQSLYRELRQSADVVSFVRPSAADAPAQVLQLKFDIAKHVIDVRVKERDELAAADKRRETKQQILALIEKKKGEALEGKSLEELEALAASLVG